MSYKSNLNGVLSHYEKASRGWLSECGDIGLKAIIAETPFITGELRKENKVEKFDDKVVWSNDKEYAAYVEYGTYKMSARMFMRRAIVSSIKRFTSLLNKYF